MSTTGISRFNVQQESRQNDDAAVRSLARGGAAWRLVRSGQMSLCWGGRNKLIRPGQAESEISPRRPWARRQVYLLQLASDLAEAWKEAQEVGEHSTGNQEPPPQPRAPTRDHTTRARPRTVVALEPSDPAADGSWPRVPFACWRRRAASVARSGARRGNRLGRDGHREGAKSGMLRLARRFASCERHRRRVTAGFVAARCPFSRSRACRVVHRIYRLSLFGVLYACHSCSDICLDARIV